MTLSELQEIKNKLEEHEKRIRLLEGKKISRSPYKTKEKWYNPGSTIDKILLLIEEEFFNIPHSIGEIVSELKTKDYHLKSSDLTLPLRNIVRKGLLKKTKTKSDSSSSNFWLYVKV